MNGLMEGLVELKGRYALTDSMLKVQRDFVFFFLLELVDWVLILQRLILLLFMIGIYMILILLESLIYMMHVFFLDGVKT